MGPVSHPRDFSTKGQTLINPGMSLGEEQSHHHVHRQFVFGTVDVHRALYRERGLLNSAGKEIKNKEEIMAMLEPYGCRCLVQRESTKGIQWRP